MSCGDAQQGQSGTVWRYPVLLPIAERVNTDTERFRELLLSQTDETSQRGYIAWLKPTCNDSLPLRSRQGSLKFLAR
jgi:hypothetical protein